MPVAQQRADRERARLGVEAEHVADQEVALAVRLRSLAHDDAEEERGAEELAVARRAARAARCSTAAAASAVELEEEVPLARA